MGEAGGEEGEGGLNFLRGKKEETTGGISSVKRVRKNSKK